MMRVTAVFSMLLAMAAPASAQQDFYAGKTITVIVGSGAGGGYDLLARLMTRHLGRHIPGHPAFVVQNLPTANSLVAANNLFNLAPKDGSTIGLLQRGMITLKFFNPGGVRFDVAKFNWLGSLNTETAATAVWHTAPHRTAQDLFERELVVGGMTGIDPEITPRLYNALIGTRFKIILGYSGTPNIALAMERGEVQGIGHWSWSSLKKQKPDWVRDQKIRVLLQGGLRKEPDLAGVPSALEFVRNEADRTLMQLHFSQQLAARPLAAPPDVPADRVALLRKAFMALASDPEFLAEAERTGLEVDLVPGEEVQRVIGTITSAPQDLIDRYIAAIKPGDRP
jgi:hypothetical protein